MYVKKLRIPKKNRVGAREKYAILGTLFPTLETAKKCGEHLKTALSLFAAEKRFGLDRGQDRPTSGFSQAIKDNLKKELGVQIRDDVHGLDVFPEQPPVKRFQIKAQLQSTYIIRDFQEPLRNLYHTSITLTLKQQLALDIYNLSHFESAPKTRFLLLITVVEILASRSKCSAQVSRLITEIIHQVKASSVAQVEKDKLCNGLTNLYTESITSACCSLVEKHSSASEAAYFKLCYTARSKLLHTGETKSPEPNNPTKLDELVSRILLHDLRVKHTGA
jgi:hypothetical protein